MNNLSPDPGVPQTPTKAVFGGIVAAVATVILTGGAVLATALDKDSDGGERVTAQETTNIVLAALGSPVIVGGVVGGTVYKVKNKRK